MGKVFHMILEIATLTVRPSDRLAFESVFPEAARILSSAEGYIALVLFCLVATAVYLALEIYAGFWPTQAQAFLASIRKWIDTHTDQVIIVLSLVLGLWLVGKSIYLIVM